MSIAEIERFAADLKSNDALRAEAEKAQADKSIIVFAATKGYAFTADDVKEYAKGRELADAELDGVAGGEANPNLSERASDDLKAKILYQQQINDILANITKSLDATIQSPAKSIKGG